MWGRSYIWVRSGFSLRPNMFHGYEPRTTRLWSSLSKPEEEEEELNRGRIACHAKQKQNQQAWLAIHHHGPWTALTGLEQTVKNYILTYYNTPNSFVSHCWCGIIKYSTLLICKVSLKRYTLLLNEGIPRALKGEKLRLKIPRVLPSIFELFLVFQIWGQNTGYLIAKCIK